MERIIAQKSITINSASIKIINNLHSKELVSKGVFHSYDGSIWSFSYEAQNLTEKIKFVSVSAHLLLRLGIPGSALVQGTGGEGTRAGRQRFHPLLTCGFCRLEAAGGRGQVVRRMQAEKIQPSVRVCEWWRPSCLRGSQHWGGVQQLLHVSVWHTFVLFKVKLP